MLSADAKTFSTTNGNQKIFHLCVQFLTAFDTILWMLQFLPLELSFYHPIPPPPPLLLLQVSQSHTSLLVADVGLDGANLSQQVIIVARPTVV